MASQLNNEMCCIKHCWDVNEQDSIKNSVHLDYWTGEWAIIPSNDERYYLFNDRYIPWR